MKDVPVVNDGRPFRKRDEGVEFASPCVFLLASFVKYHFQYRIPRVVVRATWTGETTEWRQIWNYRETARVLVLYGLTEKSEEGHRLTDYGLRFFQGAAKVPARIIRCGNKVVGRSAKLVGIRDIYGIAPDRRPWKQLAWSGLPDEDFDGWEEAHDHNGWWPKPKSEEDDTEAKKAAG